MSEFGENIGSGCGSMEPLSSPIAAIPVDDNPSQTETNRISESSQKSPTQKRKTTSVVWNSFKKVKMDGGWFAICNGCNSKLKADSKNGTNHMHNHLKRCVKSKNKDIRQQILKASERKIDGKLEYRNFVFDPEISRRELATMIVLHEYPLSIVDHIGFRKYSSSLQPMFKMVSRNTIKSDILKIYEAEKSKAYKMFEKLKARVAITTDMWTSNSSKKGFMAITAHFVDDSWMLQSQILRFVYVPAPHNKETIAEVLIDSLLDWNIDRKLSTITMDNCTTNDAVINVLLDKLDGSSLLVDGKMLHMRCCAHILNLIVKDGLDVIGDGIARIRENVLFWTASQGRVEKFEEAARQLRIPHTRKLCLDCKTRWNSTYLMIQSALNYKDVFPRLRQRERNYTCLPTEEDWTLATDICERLKLFFDVTELFSGTKYPTANEYFSRVFDIRLALYGWLDSLNEVIKSMASKMIAKFCKYWDICHRTMAIAVVLDPRYKMELVKVSFSLIYGDTVENEIDKFRQMCYDLVDDYHSKVSKTDNMMVESSCAQSTMSQQVGLLSKFQSIMNTKTTTVHKKTEFDHYLDDGVLPGSSNFDVLSWWKTNGVKFPILQKIARDILAIPVSTVASESAFSTGGRLVSPQRSSLHPTTIEALMCTQSWLWNETQVSCSNTGSSCTSVTFDVADGNDIECFTHSTVGLRDEDVEFLG